MARGFSAERRKMILPKESCKSWCDLRKRQLALLAASLQGRVDYRLTRYHEVHNVYGRADILADGKIALSFSWVEMYEQEMYNYNPAHEARWHNHATYCDSEFINVLTAYRHLSIADALVHEHYLIRVLAILDRRTGKRTLQRIIREDDWNGYPEWARRFCKLRFDAEGLPYQDAPRPFPHPPATQPYFSQLVRGAFSSNAPQ